MRTVNNTRDTLRHIPVLLVMLFTAFLLMLRCSNGTKEVKESKAQAETPEMVDAASRKEPAGLSPGQPLSDRTVGSSRQCDTSKQQVFPVFLSSLDGSKPSSFIDAKNRFRELYPPACTNAQSGYLLLREFWSNSAEKLNKAFWLDTAARRLLLRFEILPGSPGPQHLPDLSTMSPEMVDAMDQSAPGARLRLQAFGDAGMSFYMSEGDWYLGMDEDYQYRVVLADYEFGFKEYLKFIRDEVRQVIVEDAGIQVPWDELRKKLLRFEAFARSHRDDGLIVSKCDQQMKFIFTFYISGCDNTPVFDFMSRKMLPEVRQSYETFLAQNSESRFAPYVKKTYDITNRNSGKASDELLTYRRKLIGKGVINY